MPLPSSGGRRLTLIVLGGTAQSVMNGPQLGQRSHGITQGACCIPGADRLGYKRGVLRPVFRGRRVPHLASDLHFGEVYFVFTINGLSDNGQHHIGRLPCLVAAKMIS